MRARFDDRVLFLLSGLAVLVSHAGCGQRMPVAPVSGTITYHGKPLVGASITTQPIAIESLNPGPGSFGTTDQEGRYELELVNPPRKGAIIGEHRVMISRSIQAKAEAATLSLGDDPHAHLNVDQRWPARFTDGSLRLVVPPEGTTAADFAL